MKLTPHPILLSLSIRLLQVTVAISPSAAKGASKGKRFSARIRSEGPRRQMRDLETWARGELRRRNRKIYQTEGAADFRERVRRSIWPSELRLSCDRILPARGNFIFWRKSSSLVVCFCRLGRRAPFVEEVPLQILIYLLGQPFLKELKQDLHLFVRAHGDPEILSDPLIVPVAHIDIRIPQFPEELPAVIAGMAHEQEVCL